MSQIPDGQTSDQSIRVPVGQVAWLHYHFGDHLADPSARAFLENAYGHEIATLVQELHKYPEAQKYLNDYYQQQVAQQDVSVIKPFDATANSLIPDSERAASASLFLQGLASEVGGFFGAFFGFIGQHAYPDDLQIQVNAAQFGHNLDNVLSAAAEMHEHATLNMEAPRMADPGTPLYAPGPSKPLYPQQFEPLGQGLPGWTTQVPETDTASPQATEPSTFGQHMVTPAFVRDDAYGIMLDAHSRAADVYGQVLDPQMHGIASLPDSTVLDAHGQILDAHGQVLDPQMHGIASLPDGTVLDAHGQILDTHSQLLDAHGIASLPDGTVLDAYGQVLDGHGHLTGHPDEASIQHINPPMLNLDSHSVNLDGYVFGSDALTLDHSHFGMDAGMGNLDPSVTNLDPGGGGFDPGVGGFDPGVGGFDPGVGNLGPG